jgi:hypothetical protein
VDGRARGVQTSVEIVTIDAVGAKGLEASGPDVLVEAGNKVGAGEQLEVAPGAPDAGGLRRWIGRWVDWAAVG